MEDIESCYLKELDVRLEDVEEEDGSTYLVFDKTFFYPVGGGQPSDTGWIKWNGHKTPITEVIKRKRILHKVEGDIPTRGETVHISLDWDRRYSHMRMHTAQHLISSVVWEKFRASTVGNQIHSDRSHIDFYPADFTMEDLTKVQSEMNRLIGEKIPVGVHFLSRKEVEKEVEKEKVDLSRLPKSVKELRVIKISNGENIDICPCAGTHVRNLEEIGQVNIVKRKSKGKWKIRVTYVLE